MSYEATAKEDIVREINSKNVDLTVYIQRFLDYKTQLQVLPQIKTVPDTETLELYNIHAENEQSELNRQIVDLYNDMKPIKDAGLLPSKYDYEYTQ